MLVLFYFDDILIVNIPTPEGRRTPALFTEALEQRYELKNIGELNWALHHRDGWSLAPLIVVTIEWEC
jgi:hypothetical protein